MLLGIQEKNQKIIYEKIDKYKIVPIFIIEDSQELFEQRKLNNEPMEGHWHRSIEIMYTNQSGDNSVIINGKTISLLKDTIYIVNSRDIHSVVMPKEATYYTGYTIQMNYSFLKTICPDIDSRRFYVDDTSKQYLLPLLEMIKKLYNEDIMKNKDIIISLCEAFIHVLVTYASKIDIAKEKIIDKKILDILDYIDMNYQHDLNVQSIVQEFHISYTYLARLFKENIGMTANQYINHLRYEKALIDLATTNHTITDIAYLHGFPNVSSFIREFKKNKGMTPHEYRKLIE